MKLQPPFPAAFQVFPVRFIDNFSIITIHFMVPLTGQPRRHKSPIQLKKSLFLVYPGITNLKLTGINRNQSSEKTRNFSLAGSVR